MKESTQVYLLSEGRVLMMYRDRKKNDMNQGKWIAPGGKLEEGETPEDCAVREMLEETGYRIIEYEKKAEIMFVNSVFDDEMIHVYTATGFEKECDPVSDEGLLEWIDIEDTGSLNMWEGDRLFLDDVLKGKDFFRMTLLYDEYVLTGWKRE